MPFITFIYKIEEEPRTYYGKYVAEYISDDHEGLDEEVKTYLLPSIDKYRDMHKLSVIKKVFVGVLAFSEDNPSANNTPTNSTEDEIECFDYYHQYFNGEHKVYLNGSLIENKKD
jgi:hypothetical protein